MREAYSLVWSVLVLLFQSRISLEAEVLILRHQLNIQRRRQPKRLTFSAMDRMILVGLYRLAPNTIKALTIVKPDTVIRWHRAGFRLYWRWKSRHRCGRPAYMRASRVKRFFPAQYFFPFFHFKRLTRAQFCIDGTAVPLAWPR
jgi:hypothetical protein